MREQSDWGTTPIQMRELRTLELSASILYRGKVSNPNRVQRGIHSQYVWWRVLKGGCLLKVGGTKRRVRPGEWVLIPAAVLREQWFEEASEIVSINFRFLWPGSIPVMLIPRLLTGDANTIPGLYSIADAMCEAMESGSPPKIRRMNEYTPSLSNYLTFQMELNRFVKCLLDYAETKGGEIQRIGSGDNRLERILAQLRSEPKAGPLPYTKWEIETGIGRSQLERLALSHLGSRLRIYRDQFLILRACDLLTTSTHRVKEIAEQLGFVDSAHFCRWVRRRTGHSPLNLRNVPV